MATTGAKSPTAVVTVSESPWSNDDWVSAVNIYGAGYASVTGTTFDSGDQTYVLKAYGFDMSSIPADANIVGVTCVVVAKYASALASINLCQLLDISRAKVGTNLASTPRALTTSDASYTFGGSSELWGNALTVAWLQDADFGVALGCIAGGSGNNNVDVYIDSVTLEVTYNQNKNISAGVGVLTLTGYAPTVAVTQNKVAEPGVGVLTLTGFAPTVFASDKKEISPGTGVLTLTGYIPTVSVTEHKNITVGYGQLILTGYAPTVTITAPTWTARPLESYYDSFSGRVVKKYIDGQWVARSIKKNG